MYRYGPCGNVQEMVMKLMLMGSTNGTWSRWVRWFLILALFGVSEFVAEGQSSAATIFQFHNDRTRLSDPVSNHGFLIPNSNAKIELLSDTDFTCLGDFNVNATGGNIDLQFLALPSHPSENVDDTEVTGRCLYRNPVVLLESPDASTGPQWVTSFSTMFRVVIHSNLGALSSGHHQGLAFIITGDDRTQGEGGGYLGWLNSTANGDKLAHNFFVEIDFSDLEFSDPVGVNVGVNVNNRASVHTHQIGVEWASRVHDPNSFMETGKRVWIEYDGPTQILKVTIGEAGDSDTADNKPTNLLISTKVELTHVFQNSMFVGFSGSVANVANSYPGTGFDITEWTFNSNGPAPDRARSAEGTEVSLYYKARRALYYYSNGRHRHRNRLIRLIAIIVAAGVVLFLICVFCLCSFFRRRAQSRPPPPGTY